MGISPRVYLFHGFDSLGSYKSLRTWIDIFGQKHPDGKVSYINMDELDMASLTSVFFENIEVNSLFPAPKLIIIKRYLSQDKGRALSYSKHLVEMLNVFLEHSDDSITILLWEERKIPDNHHFYKYITGLEGKGMIKIYHFPIPDKSRLWKYAQDYLASHGCALSLECRDWLVKQFDGLEQRQRQEAGLKFGEELKFDQRTWWLKQLMDLGIIYAKNPEISLKELQDLSLEINPQIQIFSIIKELEKKEWNRAREMYYQLSLQSDDSQLFAYYGALRWFFCNQLKTSQRNWDLAKYGQKLMGEIEMISKNGLIPNIFLIDLLIQRLECFDKNGLENSLIDLRKVWVSRFAK